MTVRDFLQALANNHLISGLWGRFSPILVWIVWLIGRLVRPLYWLLLLLRRPLIYLARISGADKMYPWRYLMLISKPYWHGEERLHARALMIGAGLLMLANAGAWYVLGARIGHLNDVIKNIDSSHFLSAALWMVAAIAAWSVINVVYNYICSWWGAHWRKFSTEMMLRLWSERDAYLHMSTEYPQLTNMDQRLAQDNEICCGTIVYLGNKLSDAIVSFIVFTVVLLRAGPVWLFLVCVAFAVISWIVTFIVGKLVPVLTKQLANNEGNLRTHLQGVIAQAHAVALQMSEQLMLRESVKRIRAIYDTLRQVQKVNRNVSIFTTLWGQLVQNFPLIGIGWLFMHGSADFGLIALGGFAFGKVYEALTLPSREWGPISTLKAELERLGPVVEALEAIGQNHMPEGDWIEYGHAETVMFQDVTVFNSYLQQKPAVQHLTLNVTDNVMFAGEDGQGKRSLAEAITNSAARGQGKILRPVLCEIIGAVAPPYLQRSTLREFLCDRCVDPMPSDQDLLRLLHDIGLPHLNELTQGVDTEQDWKAVLSAPEQLLLCLARIVVSGAKVVVIEGATASVEPEVEEWFYKVLRLKQLRFISFTNDTRVAKYHDRVIELDEHGTPTEVPAAEYQMPRWKIFLRRLSSGDKPDAG